MKRLTQWSAAAGLMALATAARAQTVMPVSDFGGPGPYAAIRSAAPRLLAPAEVTAVLRERGFAPLGNPQQRGIVYTVSAIDPAGDDGKLVIDARSGRIIRFLPAWRMGNRFDETLDLDYGPVGPLPPLPAIARRGPRPPLPIPHVTNRAAITLPKPPPRNAPAAQSAQAPAAATTPVEPKPMVQIQPTRQMPAAQGLD